jgi:hypothetical protein
MTAPPRLTPGDELACNIIVRRVATKPSWLEKRIDKFVFSAFLLRPGEEDLSVDVVALRSQEETMRPFSPCHGLATLHVGRIRDLGLKVIFDPIDDPPEKRNPAHAKIIGMPSQAEDAARALDLAYRLASDSRVTYRRRPLQP